MTWVIKEDDAMKIIEKDKYSISKALAKTLTENPLPNEAFECAFYPSQEILDSCEMIEELSTNGSNRICINIWINEEE